MDNLDWQLIGLRTEQAVRAAGGMARVAVASNVSLRTISRVRGGEPIKLSSMMLIAQACNVTHDWLLYGDGPSPLKKVRPLDVPPAPSAVPLPQMVVPTGDSVPFDVATFDAAVAAFDAAIGLFPRDVVGIFDGPRMRDRFIAEFVARVYVRKERGG